MNKEQVKELLKELSWPLAAATVAVVVILVFLIPKVNQIFSLRADIKEQNQEINQLKQKLADLSTLSEAELFESSSLALEALPAEGDLFRNMTMVRQIFKENGVTLDSLKLVGAFATGSGQTTSQVAGLSALTMNVSFLASFENFRQMIKSIERMLPLTAVEGVKFGSLETAEATESAALTGLSGKMNVISFFSPLPKSLGRVDQLLPKVSNQEMKLIEDLRSYSRYQAGVPVPEPVSSPSAIGRDNPFSI
ncbi:MAG TPA: GspMb/PilO family protein [Patescibacteria group bacterium]|nr:GspMb/PilO family protein [Patescibacteria group bacterium]